MRGPLYFRLLGPLTVERDGEPLRIGGNQRRGVLALLLLRAGKVVSVDDFVEALWDDTPPASFRVQLQVLVSGLRKALGSGAAAIETCPPGYRLCLPSGRLDLAEFRADVETARRRMADGEPAPAAELFGAALTRWRGPALADVPYPVIRQAAVALDELRLAALEDRIDADIALGRCDDLIAELGPLTEEHPFRERFRGQLMTVLARAGRPAEALNVYLRTRELLVTELGIEPSGQLQHLQRAILMGVHEVTAGLEVRPYLTPRQLPPDVAALVGRDRPLALALELLRGVSPAACGAAPAPPSAARGIAVTGRGGVGKTAFALHLAHRLRGDFPDGQLYARLGRLGAEAVLAGFLHALGVPPGGVPDGVDARAVLFRDLLSGRRMLIVLDDASSEAEVRPLLPAEPGCGLIVTSRRRLTGLEPLCPVPLEALAVEHGVALLRQTAGGPRIDAEPAAAAEVVRHCGSLPLALRVAGARFAARPNWMVGDLARRLAGTRDRLDWLQAGDQGVRASLAESYAGLEPEQQRLFRLLGLLDRPEFPGWLPAALLGVGPATPGGAGTARAERLLEGLVDVHLVEPASRGVTGPRYRLHDLIHLVAREFAVDADTAPTRRAALGRALHGWLAAAATADDMLPHWLGLDPEPEPGWRPPDDVLRAVRAAPLKWFDEERDTLLDVARQAAAEARPEVAWPLAQRLSTYLDLRGRNDEWADVLRCGLRAAGEAGDDQGRATMLSLLVQVESNRDEYVAAISYARQTLAAYRNLSRENAPRARPAPPQSWIGPDLPEPAKALRCARAHGDPLAIGFAASRLALARWRAGVRGDYLGLLEEARAAFLAGGEGVLELWTTKFVAVAYARQGRIAEAEECLHRAVELFTRWGDRLETGSKDLAGFAMDHGLLRVAEVLAEESVEQARAGGDQWSTGRALMTLGEISAARGDQQAALDACLNALEIWQTLNIPTRILQALYALSELCGDLGDPHAAAVYRTEYTPLLHQLEITEADLRARWNGSKPPATTSASGIGKAGELGIKRSVSTACEPAPHRH